MTNVWFFFFVPEPTRLPPSAIGALVASTGLVVLFLSFKCAHDRWKRRQRQERYLARMMMRSATEPAEQFNPANFLPPPSYQECMVNPAFVPDDPIGE